MQINVVELRPPKLEFGDGRALYADPRLGLAAAGPFSLRFGRAHKSQIRLGMVGPTSLLKSASEWYQRCDQKILTGKPPSAMYLEFPGFERAFQAVVAVSDSWQVNIDHELDEAFAASADSRFERVLDAYSDAVSRLARNYSLDVITCCLPHEVLTRCWSATRTNSTTMPFQAPRCCGLAFRR